MLKEFKEAMNLNEMAYSRQDAIERCYSLGKEFIEHFNKCYNSSDEELKLHWLSEMQAWLDKVNDIRLKSNNKPLSMIQKIDWFYSFGSSYEDYLNNEEESNIYEQFIERIEKDNCNVFEAYKACQ